jgi:hypothetical protein
LRGDQEAGERDRDRTQRLEGVSQRGAGRLDDPGGRVQLEGHRVATRRSASARARRRESQRRTVDTGRSSWTAIARCPAPAALARLAAPITSAAFRRRGTVDAGSKTSVVPQPRYSVRRARALVDRFVTEVVLGGTAAIDGTGT